jgi:hypothetical protein
LLCATCLTDMVIHAASPTDLPVIGKLLEVERLFS